MLKIDNSLYNLRGENTCKVKPRVSKKPHNRITLSK